MKKGYWLLGSIILLLIVQTSLTFFKPFRSQLCCNDYCFILELARSPKERQAGLMFRETLADNAGMLFIFDQEDHHSFWMKNTLIPLDILRLHSGLQIVDIQQAQPCEADPCPSYLPSSSAQYVLELNQGISKKSGIEIGNQCFLFDE